MRQSEFDDVLAFVAVARAAGFRGAAARGAGSAASLSDAVRRLEDRIGVRLLNRTTRSVMPTEAGRALLDRLDPGLREISSALDGVGGDPDRPMGTLRLSVPHAVARMFLPDLVPAFLLAFPGVRVEIVADDSFVDVVSGGFDAGIRYEERLEQDMVAVPIGPRADRYVAVAAPAYLERHGRPTHPNELTSHAAVRHRFLHGTILPWEFERDGETVMVAPKGRIETNSLELQRAAVAAGVGIATTFEGFYADMLADGRVVEILPDWSTRFSGPFLYYSSRRLMPSPLRAFVDFARQWPWNAETPVAATACRS